MLELKSINKSYGDNQVLKDINLSFSEGEVAGVVGENGAGKTTLFRCIAGLEDFDGDVTYSEGILKNTLGFLPTDPHFMSKTTGLEYLTLLCHARGIEVSDFEEKNVFDLPLNQYAETYSTGMKKKLALTATLLQKNEVFIFDEPFNGVDIQSNIVITEVIQKLKELNKIVILSSHIFSTLNQTCDVLHHLKGGEILKSVGKEAFQEVEASMKDSSVASRIDRLELS